MQNRVVSQLLSSLAKGTTPDSAKCKSIPARASGGHNSRPYRDLRAMILLGDSSGKVSHVISREVDERQFLELLERLLARNITAA